MLALMNKRTGVELELIEKHEELDLFTRASVRSPVSRFNDGLNSLRRLCQVAECVNILTNEQEN